MAHSWALRISTNPFDDPWQGSGALRWPMAGARGPSRRPLMAHRRGSGSIWPHVGTTYDSNAVTCTDALKAQQISAGCQTVRGRVRMATIVTKPGNSRSASTPCGTSPRTRTLSGAATRARGRQTRKSARTPGWPTRGTSGSSLSKTSVRGSSLTPSWDRRCSSTTPVAGSAHSSPARLRTRCPDVADRAHDFRQAGSRRAPPRSAAGVRGGPGALHPGHRDGERSGHAAHGLRAGWRVTRRTGPAP
jgi:hypothetical protein